MTQTTKDTPIEEIRELRRQISARFENDPAQLVDHYLKMQEQYRERMIDASPPTKRRDQTAA
jgi:hypothetical protein